MSNDNQESYRIAAFMYDKEKQRAAGFFGDNCSLLRPDSLVPESSRDYAVNPLTPTYFFKDNPYIKVTNENKSPSFKRYVR